MESIIKSYNKLEAEIGKPMDISIKLDKEYETITISIGYYLNGIAHNERFVCIFETYYNCDIINIDYILNDIAVPTYKGKLISISWFIELILNNQIEKKELIVYPMNYRKLTGK